MEAKELMIDDLVKCGEPDCEGHRVDYINEMDDEVGVDGEILNLNMIFPLPLTPEILERNGFIKELDSDCIHYKFTLIQGHSQFSLLYARSVFQWLYTIDFKYIHELQHVLKLCGIDKEIEL